MSSLCGPWMCGKRALSAATMSAVSSTESVVCVTEARRAGTRGPQRAASPPDCTSVMAPAGGLPSRSDHFGMVGVPDQHDLAAALMVDLGLAVHLRHQRTGGVEREQVALLGLRGNRLRHAVRGENHRRVGIGNLVELFREDGAL